MSRAELDLLLGEVRDLSERYKAGGQDAFDAFRDLVARLLSLTVLAPYGTVALFAGPRGRDTQVLSGRRAVGDPLPLNENRGYLRLVMTLSLVQAQGRQLLKVMNSGCQYQLDEAGERWIFRYDYRRVPPDPYPAAHLQIRGRLDEDCLPPGRTLARIHFPSGRVSIEAVTRLLVDQFGVPTTRRPELWRPVLSETERIFHEIAHIPPSGPAQ